MQGLLKNWFYFQMDFSAEAAGYAATIAVVVLVAVLCVLGSLLLRWILTPVVRHATKNTKHSWEAAIEKNRIPRRMSHLMSPLIISLFAEDLPIRSDLLQRGLAAYIILVFLLVADAILSAADDIYLEYEISKIRPIKGFLQVTKIILFIIGAIILLASLIGQSPLVLLGGISALTAVFLLIFQNAILGFVAGIQLTSNDMLRIGDWIEMPKYDANGTVLEISLCTVKVQNFDNSITTIPANALTTDSFRNWRGMQESGGRRIMRSVPIDMTSICFCTPELLTRLQEQGLLILPQANDAKAPDKIDSPTAQEATEPERITNLTLFRLYLTQYLQHHPGIQPEMSLMVRELEPQATGIPLQLYAFSRSTDWKPYESTQSDIFEHLLAVMPQFGLRTFQNPSGHDLTTVLKTNTDFTP